MAQFPRGSVGSWKLLMSAGISNPSSASGSGVAIILARKAVTRRKKEN